MHNFVTALFSLSAALQASQPYALPSIASPPPSALLHNVVESYPLVQTSPLDLIVRAPLASTTTMVQDATYGRLETYVRNSAGVEQPPPIDAQGNVSFVVQLPTNYAPGQGWVLTVNVLDVDQTSFFGAKEWVQTQSFKRNFRIIDLP